MSRYLAYVDGVETMAGDDIAMAASALFDKVKGGAEVYIRDTLAQKPCHEWTVYTCGQDSLNAVYGTQLDRLPDLLTLKLQVDGHDYTYHVWQNGRVIEVFDANGYAFADAEFDSGVEQVFYSIRTQEEGTVAEGDLSYFEFQDKYEELARALITAAQEV